MTAPGVPAGRASVVLVFSLLVLIWGTTWYAIKIGLAYYPPFFSLAVRFGLAGPIILGLLRWRGERIPWAPRHQPFFLLLGVLSYVTSFGIVYWGEQYVSSGLTAVIFGLFPLFTGVVAHWMLPAERLGPWKLFGLCLGLAGIAVIHSSDLAQFHPQAPLVTLVLVVSPLVTSISNVLSKKRLHEFPALAFAGIPMIYASLFHLVAFFLWERERPLGWSWPGVGAIAYLTLCGSVVTFSGYFWLLRRLEVTRTALIAYLTPLVALAVGVGFGGEPLPLPVVLGTLFVLAGVAVANRATAKRAVVRPPVPETQGTPRSP